MRFDRSWIPAIVVIFLIFTFRNEVLRLPYEMRLLIGLAGGGWLLWTGIQLWRRPVGRGYGQQPGRSRVQYWRGQRIVLDDEPRRRPGLAMPPTPQALTAALYALTGALAVAIVISGLVRYLG